MSQNQEIIESKLCAYVDGELDAEGRAEIEKHLNANPQHRRLLESLRATRDLLRWLPREQAPPELAETLNGQLERSVLLDYEGDSLRIPIWPRIFAAAAIIALTVGLGAAVFYALPRSQKPALAIGSGLPHETGSPSNIEEARSSDKSALSPATAATDLATESHATNGELAEAERGKELASANNDPAMARKGGFSDADFLDRAKKTDEAPAAAAQVSGNARQLAAADLDQLAEQVAQNPTVLMAASDSASNVATQSKSLPTGNAMVMLVRSDAPERAEKQLTSYFKSQQIPWRQTQLPAQDLEQTNQLSNAQTKEGDLSLGNHQQAAKPAAPQEKQFALKDASQKPAAGAFAGKDEERPYPTADALQERREQAPGRVAGTQPAQSNALTADKRQAQMPVAVAQNNLQNQAANGLNAQQQMRVADNAANGYRGNGVYVVQMSRRQAEFLCTTISSQPAQAAQTRDISGLAYNNNGSPDGAVLGNAPGARSQFGADGRNEYGLRSALPSTQPAQAVAAPAPLAKAVATALGEDEKTAKSLDSKGSSDKRAETRPTESLDADKPDNGHGYLGGTSLSRLPVPATQPVRGAIAPSTQPTDALAAPSSAPSDEPMSVVILVEANKAPASLGAGPQTQPAEAAQAETSPVPAPSSQPALNAK